MIIEKFEHFLLLLVELLEADSTDSGIVLVFIVLIVNEFGCNDDRSEKKSMNVFWADFKTRIFLLNFVNQNEAVDVSGRWASHVTEDSWSKIKMYAWDS